MGTLAAVAPASPRLRVDELTLTRWSLEDLDELGAMHEEPETMAPFGGALARVDSDAYAARVDAWFDTLGYGLFAVHDADGSLLGSVGLAAVPLTIPIPYDVEVGWRLRRGAWGRGIATRAARGVLKWARAAGGPEHVCSFTSATNERSAAVMRRLGLHRRADLDFDHPAIPSVDPRRPHIVYATEPAP